MQKQALGSGSGWGWLLKAFSTPEVTVLHRNVNGYSQYMFWCTVVHWYYNSVHYLHPSPQETPGFGVLPVFLLTCCPQRLWGPDESTATSIRWSGRSHCRKSRKRKVITATKEKMEPATAPQWERSLCSRADNGKTGSLHTRLYTWNKHRKSGQIIQWLQFRKFGTFIMLHKIFISNKCCWKWTKKKHHKYYNDFWVIRIMWHWRLE